MPFKPPLPAVCPEAPWSRLITVLMGIWIATVMVKFGNPVILDHLATQQLDWTGLLYPLSNIETTFSAPEATGGGLIEFLSRPWPFKWGFWSLGVLLLVSIKAVRWQTEAPIWLIVLPGVWLAWQCLAATHTVSPALTKVTLEHFSVCAAGFYFGLFVLSPVKNLTLFWAGLAMGLAVVLWYGFGQHYGGLEALRRSIYERPDWQRLPEVFLKRVISGRIFSTLIYPNALAGLILSVLPVSLVACWRMSTILPRVVRGVAVGLLGYSGLACLFWTGSKAGWLIVLVQGIVLLFQMALRRRTKWILLGLVVVLGITGFFLKFSHYFQRGATSVVARFDYWQAAWETAKTNPLLGTGPGTFAVPYRAIKSPDSEMARLCHNDYLEQASDSGFIGFISYAAFIIGFLGFLYRKLNQRKEWFRFAVWLGLLGWALQCFVEFGLYIPAISWPAFILMGWSLGKKANQNGIDNPGMIA